MFDDLEIKNEQQNMSKLDQPDDIFDFDNKNEGKNKKNSFIKQDNSKHVTTIENLNNNTLKTNNHKTILSILAIDSLAKFFIYVIITLLVVGLLSFWVADLLTINF